MLRGVCLEAASDEVPDPVRSFVPGVKIWHQIFGDGEIESLEFRGESRLLTVQFAEHGRKLISVNLAQMRVREEGDGDHLT